jgi:catechol 2,3-dioxygenase-like lactoylglutathione lyase family enzyme
LRQLEIVERLEVRDGRGAQVFVCRRNGEVTEYVAKVYDPLYYGFVDLLQSDLPRDVTYFADGDYTREVAAYAFLEQHGVRNPEVPAYHGSWTFDLPTHVQDTNSRTAAHTRPVRMLLIEYIDGKALFEMNPAKTPTHYRLKVLSQMMETETRLRHLGLSHNDFSPNSVLVCGYDTFRSGPTRVCLFDFHDAVITECLEDVAKSGVVRKKTALPLSPADLWWDRLDITFKEWMPDGWDKSAWHRWLLDKYSGSETFELPQRTLHDDENEAMSVANIDASDDSTPYARPVSPGIGGIRGSPGNAPMDESLLKGTEPEPLLGHLSIGVADYTTAKHFYSALKCLGMDLVYDSEANGPSCRTRTLGYGQHEVNELLNIFEYGDEARPPGRGCHIAFNAPSRHAVDEFHRDALACGGTCDGEPGLRLEYSPHYYAAFVISPDGWRLEAVYQKPVSEGDL